MTLAASDRKSQVVAEFRRAEILAAATKVFGNKGFDGTHMDEIARMAQIAKGTLYLYFKSKEAIYEVAVQEALVQVSALTDQYVREHADVAGKVAAFIRVRISFWQEQAPLYRVILSLSREGAHRKQSLAWLRESVVYLEALLKTAAEAGELPAQDFLAAAWAAMDAIRGVNERRVYDEGRTVEEDTRFLTGFLLTALGVRR